MERLTSDLPLPASLRGGVIALGNFDGFHLGHQAVIGRAVARAREMGRPAIVASFDPHPVRFFQPDAPPFRLTTIEQRARLFAAAGADALLLFRFDEKLARISAEQFVVERLIRDAGAAHVVTGEDFTFGRGRSGTIGTLAALGQAHGLSTEAIPPVSDAIGPISSSRIRAALLSGDCETATSLLTRPFAIEGVVQHGDKLGRTIGYPTANLPLDDYLRPAYGIYAVRGRLPGGRMVEGAANLGIRPSFDPPKELLEPHFFDFEGSLYGETIEVELISFLRPEAKFDSLDALIAQIDADCAEARRRLRPGS
ncbi:bifunctional riboflavin kinase/FMN adenylyltransferase [Sphingomonas oleivorans]|uniref:Riboflavin biosynthesis protein n=1 Tax=Sphingomonas oleivorans TaxID=1735121 RepID=A0A2T5G006_9SPHN|nr:bifunctional riboflavin kinase/FAD synthetase [Sphingomonas oleivorans]PTQ12280.1 bifunctional riboflavin kinase/FMN adenylyltransferase [Sphingomonas oleivorans]